MRPVIYQRHLHHLPSHNLPDLLIMDTSDLKTFEPFQFSHKSFVSRSFVPSADFQPLYKADSFLKWRMASQNPSFVTITRDVFFYGLTIHKKLNPLLATNQEARSEAILCQQKQQQLVFVRDGTHPHCLIDLEFDTLFIEKTDCKLMPITRLSLRDWGWESLKDVDSSCPYLGPLQILILISQ